MKQSSKCLLLRLLWIVTIVCFVVGIVTPVMSIEQFYLFEQRFSIITALKLLFEDGQWWLCLLIGLFSLGIPSLKLWVLHQGIRQLAKGQSVAKRSLELIHRFGRWSMLDVFVLAVFIVAIKLSAFASVSLHYGLFTFAAAVVLMLVLTAWLQWESDKADADQTL